MGLFGRDKKRDETARGRPPIDRDGPDQIGDDELEDAVAELEQMVAENMSEAPIPRETLELLQIGLPHLIQRECSDDAVVAGQTAARLGYLSRAGEFAMFEGELEPEADLVQTLSEALEQAEKEGTPDGDAMAELAAAIAANEPLDPSAADGGPSWTLPGLTGQARGTLRDNLVARMPSPSDIVADDLRRTWKYGYFLRALDELCED